MKKFSKILSVILAIMLTVFSFPVYADEEAVTMTISADKTDVMSGDTVTINIDLSDNSGIGYLTFDVLYDNSKLEYVSHNVYDVVPGAIVNPDYADGIIRFAHATVNDITEGGTVLSIEFTVLSSSCSTVSLQIVDSANNDFVDVEISTTPALLHSYSDWTTVTEPTCEAQGQKSKTCSCGDVTFEMMSPLGHDYAEDYMIDVNASCTEEGSKSQHCSRCDSKQNITVIPATGHSYKEEITKIPTHTEDGEKTFACDNCGASYKETIEADGTHKHISSVTKEPTCTETGVMTYTCACGDVYTETIEALGHTEEVISATAPTCTNTGLTSGVKCSECGEILTAQEEIPANGHNVNKDGYCEECNEKICDHNCHKGGISGFFWKISNFFNKLFGTKKYCECGYAHY